MQYKDNYDWLYAKTIEIFSLTKLPVNPLLKK